MKKPVCDRCGLELTDDRPLMDENPFYESDGPYEPDCWENKAPFVMKVLISRGPGVDDPELCRHCLEITIHEMMYPPPKKKEEPTAEEDIPF